MISAVKSFYFLEEHDALGGLEKVGTMLDKARYSNSLSSKLTAHLQRIDRTDLIPYLLLPILGLLSDLFLHFS